MIEFLKDSTFAVNDVLFTAWRILKRHYISYLGLCALMFIVTYASSYMAFAFQEHNIGFRSIMLIFFIFLYFGIQFALFKFTLRLLDNEDEDVSLKVTIPTAKELIYFFIGTVFYILVATALCLIIAVIFLPLYYIPLIKAAAAPLALSICTIVVFITCVRISFFPFFILDKQHNPFKSLRFSLAITRGNFTRVFLLLLLFAGLGLLSFYVSNINMLYSTALFMLNFFFIAPLTAIAMVAAYRQMVDEYDGDADPEIMDNLI